MRCASVLNAYGCTIRKREVLTVFFHLSVWLFLLAFLKKEPVDYIKSIFITNSLINVKGTVPQRRINELSLRQRVEIRESDAASNTLGSILPFMDARDLQQHSLQLRPMRGHIARFMA